MSANDSNSTKIDVLTQCLTFEAFKTCITQILSQFDGAVKYALIYIDIKEFKYFNDMLGYDGGDEILKFAGQLLLGEIKGTDVVARISGDTFVTFRKYDDADEIERRFVLLSAQLSNYYTSKMQSVRVELYAGAYFIESANDILSVSEMIDRANLAQKTVKHKAGAHFAIYDEEMRRSYMWKQEVESRMYDALAAGEFEVYLQPQIDIQNRNALAGAEALIRWNYPGKGMIPPDDFIPIFERNGFIQHIDEYVFKQVCHLQADFLQQKKTLFPIAVNVSRYDLLRPNFLERYATIKKRFNLPDFVIELEFTETVLFDDHSRFRDIVKQIKQSGFLCALDDFGSGHSSLNILKDLPVDVLKIDKEFFCPSDDQEKDHAIIFSIVAMARALKMKTIAEGIETPELLHFLRKIGCNVIQGFVFSRPLTYQKFSQLVLETDTTFLETLPVIKNQAANTNDLSYVFAKYQFMQRFFNGAIIDIDIECNRYVLDYCTGENFFPVKIQPAGSYSDFIQKLLELAPAQADVEKARQLTCFEHIHDSFYSNTEYIATEFSVGTDNTKTLYSISIFRIIMDTYHRFSAVMFIQNLSNQKTLPQQAFLRAHEQKLLGAFVDAIQQKTYIINTETFELIYINTPTQKSFPKAQTGQICYKAFANRAMPCPGCPLPQFIKKGAITKYSHIVPSLSGNEKLRYTINTIALSGVKSAAMITYDPVEINGIIPQQEFEHYCNTIQLFGNSCKFGLFMLACSQPPRILYANETFCSMLGYTHQSFFDAITDGRFIISTDREPLEIYQKILNGQADGNDQVSWEYEYTKPDKTTIWLLIAASILETEDNLILLGQITDITARKIVNLKNRISEERVQLFLQNSGCILFDWNITDGQFVFQGNLIGLDGIRPGVPVSQFYLLKSKIIHPDDEHILLELAKNMQEGKCQFFEQTARLKVSTGSYLWHRINFHAIEDESKKILRIIGMIFEANDETASLHSMRRQLQHDALTGIMPRESFIEQLEFELSAAPDTEGYCAFFMLDVDNFKKINDLFGHIKGDEVLAAVGATLNRTFRDGDLVARIGGDEFSAFLPYLPSLQIAQQKGQQICEQIRKIEVIKNWNISVSVGVAIRKIITSSFYLLYDQADRALYMSKNAGRNTCSFLEE